MCPERSKTLQNFDSHFAPLCAAVLQIMGRNQKYDAIIIASLYFWPKSAFRHSFFKGDAISHPLNPGATPWYFASHYYMLPPPSFMQAILPE